MLMRLTRSAFEVHLAVREPKGQFLSPGWHQAATRRKRSCGPETGLWRSLETCCSQHIPPFSKAESSATSSGDKGPGSEKSVFGPGGPLLGMSRVAGLGGPPHDTFCVLQHAWQRAEVFASKSPHLVCAWRRIRMGFRNCFCGLVVWPRSPTQWMVQTTARSYVGPARVKVVWMAMQGAVLASRRSPGRIGQIGRNRCPVGHEVKDAPAGPARRK